MCCEGCFGIHAQCSCPIAGERTADFSLARYEVEVHVLKEFGMPEVEDWLLVCTPKTWPVAPSKSDYASIKFAEMRRWAVEVNRLCHQSQTGYVEWRSLQSRMRPILMASLAPLQFKAARTQEKLRTGLAHIQHVYEV
ncbi:Ank2 [Symbiodinium sp. CCMP2456]|nr:Ank2 [Symbiodinium sp. CCMP2456]